MNVEFKLPELGENITSGDVVTVLVREGDQIAANDGVLEVETDKAVVEIPCPYAGKIAKVHVAKGQTLKVGQPILSVEVEDEAVKPVAAAESPHPSPLPKGEGTKDVGPLTKDVGPLTKDVGPLAKGEGTKAAKPQPSAVPAGPEARRLARELGVDLAKVQGTGKSGRITVEDVRAAATPPPESNSAPSPEPNVGTPAQRGTREPAVPPGELSEDAYGHVRRQRTSRIRRTIAEKMVMSASTIPHVTNFDDADVTELERIIKTIPPAYLGPTIKLTSMPFVMKAVAVALRQHPVLNATLDEERDEIIYKQYINLGVAIDTPRGLVVPVMRNVDQMGILQLTRELTLLAARTRSAEFTVEELRGGTFTITNLGAVGGTYSTPIINHPEVAILLIGRTRWVLSVHEGKIEGRLMMPLSLSYDHRVVDGGPAGRFLNDVIDYLQSPGKLLLTK